MLSEEVAAATDQSKACPELAEGDPILQVLADAIRDRGCALVPVRCLFIGSGKT